MRFIDEVRVFVKAGDGGAGCVSFRREANVPMGGPDGGDGGRGGSIIAEGVTGLNTLIDYRYQPHLKAKRGGHGMGRNRSGASSEDIVIPMPVGTQIFLEDGETMLADITKPAQRVMLAKGGDGGLGNSHFKSSINRSPRKAIPGWPGEERELWLRLKLLSDAGLVGLPNAGKSTFLARVSHAKPKIADYPFTTLKPQLGVVRLSDQEFVLADIPGLIEGAHEGAGLGDRFLKHIERCRVLIHLVDGTAEDVADNYRIIRQELDSYSPALVEKPEIVVLNKTDALSPEEIKAKRKALKKVLGKEVFAASGASGEGIKAVLSEALSAIKALESE